MHLFHKFILTWNSTCFGQFLCPSSGDFSLYTQQWYVIEVCRQLSSRTRSCSKAVYKRVWLTPLLSVQWINSWWWTDDLSETCRVSWQNKFVKLVHLFGYIIQKSVTMHGHMNVKEKYICLAQNRDKYPAVVDIAGLLKQMLEISWLGRVLIAFHEGLCCMSLVSWLFESLLLRSQWVTIVLWQRVCTCYWAMDIRIDEPLKPVRKKGASNAEAFCWCVCVCVCVFVWWTW